MRTLVTTVVVGLAVAVLSIGQAAAGGDEHDHDRARAALERREILPLRAILDKVEREHPGKVVEVELEREHGRWIYEIRLLRSGGALVRLDVDARDGTVLGVRARDDKGGQR